MKVVKSKTKISGREEEQKRVKTELSKEEQNARGRIGREELRERETIEREGERKWGYGFVLSLSLSPSLSHHLYPISFAIFFSSYS